MLLTYDQATQKVLSAFSWMQRAVKLQDNEGGAIKPWRER